MSVPAAFAGVIVIWTTTPLAITWSGQGSHFLFALTARMLIGALVSMAVLRLSRTPLPWHRKARQNYLAGGLGIYGVMMLVYWAAQYIPSGWISVLFGLSPIVTALAATLLLGERNLGPVKLAGMLLGLGGLAVIFGGGAALSPEASLGVAAVLGAVMVQCGSAIWIKRIDAGVPALASTAGGVMVATFLLQSTWIVLDVHLPQQIDPRAAWAIVYLGVGGSVLGFSLYYYLLKHAEATKVALITLITPVSALLLGNLLNGEALSVAIVAGTGIILCGLGLFQFGEGWLRRLGPANPRP